MLCSSTTNSGGLLVVSKKHTRKPASSLPMEGRKSWSIQAHLGSPTLPSWSFLFSFRTNLRLLCIHFRITNFVESGLFLYRVSGTHPQDPRHNGAVSSLNGDAEEEYVYQDAEGEYDPDEKISEL
jgi:hypothetical protein